MLPTELAYAMKATNWTQKHENSALPFAQLGVQTVYAKHLILVNATLDLDSAHRCQRFANRFAVHRVRQDIALRPIAVGVRKDTRRKAMDVDQFASGIWGVLFKLNSIIK